MLTSARRHAPFGSCRGATPQNNEVTSMLSGSVVDAPPDTTPGNAADSNSSPQSSVGWQDAVAIDSSDDREKSPSRIDEDGVSDDDTDRDDCDEMGKYKANAFDDSPDRSSSGGSSGGGNTIAKAKRERVENIVTNIRDRPHKPRSPFADDNEEICAASAEQGESRKRRSNGSLKDWPEKISHCKFCFAHRFENKPK